MQAAFVDIGLERAAFIHAHDVVKLDNDGFEIKDENDEHELDITSLIREGQKLVVQVVKEPIATKGQGSQLTCLSLLVTWCICRAIITSGFRSA